MTRLRWALLVLLLLFAATSTSIQWKQDFDLVDAAGAPLDPVYIAYSYQGSRPNFVHPVTYQARPLALIRGDGAGRVTIATAVIFHRPFPLETHPSLWIELVYVPSRHNAWGQFNAGSPSVPGVFEIDASRQRATVGNLDDRPERWEGTLRNLSSMIHRLASRPAGSISLRELEPTTAGLTRELIRHFRQEHDAFLARYADVERPRPDMPSHVRQSSVEEQRRWTEHIDNDLSREPRWGVLITRLFSDDVRLLEQWAAE